MCFQSVRTARSEHQQAQKLSEERREQQHQRDLEQKVEQVKALADRVGTLQRELDSSRKTISSKEGEQAEVRESRQRELDQTIKRAEAGERAREEALKTYELFASAQEKDKQELNAEIAALKRQMEELDAQGKARLSEEQRRTDQLEATIQLQRDELEKSQRQVLQQQQESQVSAKARSVAASGSPSGQRMARGRPEDPHNVTSRVKQSESQQSTRVSHNALPQMPNAATPSRRDVVEDDATQKPPAKPRRKANRSASAANSNVRREPSYTEVEDSQPRRTASQLSRASTLPSRGNAQDPMLLDESERAIDTRGGGASSQVPETQLNGPRSLTEITESMSPLYHRNLRSASRDLRSASLDLTDEETLVKDAEAQNSRAKSSLPKTPVVPNSSSKVSQPHPPSRNASFNNEHLPSPGAAHHLKDSLAAQQSQTRRSIAWGPRKPDITRTQTAASTADTAPSQGFRKPSVPASKTKRKASVQSESDRSTNSNKRIKTVVADNVSDPLQPSASHHFTPKKSHAKVSQHLQPSLPASKRPKIGDAGVSPMKMARKQSTGVLRPVSSRRTRAPLPTRDDMEQLFQTTIHENQPRKR